MCACLVTFDSETPTWQIVACQSPLSMEFSRQEYWSGLPFPTPGDLPDPGIEPRSLVSPALTGRFFITVSPVKPTKEFIPSYVFRDLYINMSVIVAIVCLICDVIKLYVYNLTEFLQ